MTYEAVGIALAQHVVDNEVDTQLENTRSLLFHVHQSYVQLCSLMLRKVVGDALQNVWVQQLQRVVALKLARSPSKGEELISLITNNGTMQQTLRLMWLSLRSGSGLCGTSVSPLLNCVGNVLNQVDKCSPAQARYFLLKAQQALVQAILTA